MQETGHTLRDGRAVHLRTMRITDEDELLQGFERMSSEARYMRLMHVVREPDRERLRKLLASFPQAGIGTVATMPMPACGKEARSLRRRSRSGSRTTCIRRM